MARALTRRQRETADAVLGEVRDLGPVTVAEIAGNLSISKDSVRRMLLRLEASGLVESDAYQQRARVYLPAGGEEG